MDQNEDILYALIARNLVDGMRYQRGDWICEPLAEGIRFLDPLIPLEQRGNPLADAYLTELWHALSLNIARSVVDEGNAVHLNIVGRQAQIERRLKANNCDSSSIENYIARFRRSAFYMRDARNRNVVSGYWPNQINKDAAARDMIDDFRRNDNARYLIYRNFGDWLYKQFNSSVDRVWQVPIKEAYGDPATKFVNSQRLSKIADKIYDLYEAKAKKEKSLSYALNSLGHALGMVWVSNEIRSMCHAICLLGGWFINAVGYLILSLFWVILVGGILFAIGIPTCHWAGWCKD